MSSVSDQHLAEEPTASGYPPSSTSRAAGAELIRQLSCHKLENFYQSDETLHQFGAAKRKAAAPIVKRFSDNHYDRHQKPTAPVSRTTANAGKPAAAAATERPRLLRQSTTNSESVTAGGGGGSGGGAAHNRRRLMAETRDHRSWRSCDVTHPDVAALAGTHRKVVRNVPAKTRSTSGSIGRSGGDIATTPTSSSVQQRPSYLDLSSSSFNSVTGAAHQPAHNVVSISPSSRRTANQDQNNESRQQQLQQRADDEVEDDAPTGRQLLAAAAGTDPVRYTKGGAEGQEEDRVVLPPLAGNRVIGSVNKNGSKLLSQRMAKAAGSRTKKVLGQSKQPGADRKRPARSAPGAVAIAAIAVAVVTGSGEEGSAAKLSAIVPNPRRRARGIVILTSVFLLFTCLFLVGITLRLAPLIDDLGTYGRHLETTTIYSKGFVDFFRSPASLRRAAAVPER